jgi:hypothetical protein
MSRCIESWDGLEDKRQALIDAAYKVRDADFLDLGVAFRELEKVAHELVHVHGLDFHFVRKEWAAVLSPGETTTCDRLLAIML